MTKLWNSPRWNELFSDVFLLPHTTHHHEIRVPGCWKIREIFGAVRIIVLRVVLCWLHHFWIQLMCVFFAVMETWAWMARIGTAMSSGYRIMQHPTLRAAFVAAWRDTQEVASPQASRASCWFGHVFYSHASVDMDPAEFGLESRNIDTSVHVFPFRIQMQVHKTPDREGYTGVDCCGTLKMTSTGGLGKDNVFGKTTGTERRAQFPAQRAVSSTFCRL